MANKLFKKQLIQELINLKKFAKKSELAKIKAADEILPNDHRGCVYGLMTGDCWGERATELIKKCCKYAVNDSNNRVTGFDAYMKKFSKERRQNEYFSAVEILLFHGSKKEIKEAICFLKDCGEMPKFKVSAWKAQRGQKEKSISVSCKMK